MASSGSFTTSTYQGRCLRFYWEETGQSIEGNYTEFNWSLAGYGTASSNWYMAGNFKLTINGTTVYETGYSDRIKLYDGTPLASGSGKMHHAADGTASMAVYAEGGIYLYDVNCTGSKTFYFDTIPRGASLSAADNFTDRANPSITYSNPAGSAVTTLQACIASTDGKTIYVPYRNISKTGTKYTFELTDAERANLIKLIPNSNKLDLKFYIKTTIGGSTFYSSLQRYMAIVDAEPTLTMDAHDVRPETLALTGNSHVFVNGFSNVEYTLTAAPQKGASIAKYEATIGSKTVTHKTSNTSVSGSVEGVDGGNILFKVTDSRGNYKGIQTTATFIPYSVPTIKADIGNPTTDGEMLYRISGNWYNGKFNTTDDAIANTLTIYYRYYENEEGFADDDSDWIEVPAESITIENGTYKVVHKITGLNYRCRYSFQARVVDKLVRLSTSNVKTVSSIPVFDWSDRDFEFNVPVTFNEGYIGTNKILASGVSYMNEKQTWNLSEPVSEQPNGIVLVFSGYDATKKVALNSSINTFFVSKKDIELFPDVGHTFLLGINAGFSGMAAKYLYFTDTSVYGHEGNTSSGTNSGITFNNSKYVLRYVIGV